MASIRDVAKKANVAACTVSRVLNNSGYVAPETRDKIEKAIKELNYIPNELARGMFRQKAGIIAMLVPNIVHPFFSTLASYIEKELYKNGYKLMLCSTDDDIKKEKDYMETLKSNIVDGVISGVSNLKVKEYKDFNKPLVMLDCIINPKIPVVASNHKLGGELAARKFIESGCKNVIHICDTKATKVLSYQCHVSLEKILKSNNIEATAIEIKWNDFDFEGYLKLAKKVLMENERIDGVFAADMPASAFLKAAVQLNKSVPKDFCVVAYDGTYTTNSNILNITTVVQQVSIIASKAVENILALIEEGKIIESYTEVDIYLREGETSFKSIGNQSFSP
ncbi:ribose operon repressor [Clostridium pasteurianum DSM 525 = ATCC 6013]|uniref:Ribose operon repressor n=2 Tax=Clostridium pasteurianum TaxID=1501 RepID=A0A0H3J6Y2_CLOPA|nr:LacI family DNA-binding transcriptional regulator [Clostridium pasteurianum]AJA49229.1 ribose operon repressor [Clostridium pasteurianum DSM 525 = ATCC 6013]AJA53217.1 ribose operon repressor [Clostridium pasteurianum DSM 525 = ATCC 6013]AOZ77374.1 LacI family transcriptional regulator [Clostridium pasteurianum DSM 525 = ATCC 6013]AOZ81170.1 LacI family transcriptional regulator [Clostridium pasteurianum]ELP59162.1 LacI family transcriptional regulator [Clostridium pasteurianum DSM 525 = AT